MTEPPRHIYNSEKIAIDTASENGIILEFIRGDERALHKIFKLHHHALYGQVVQVVKSPGLASDIVHDVFIKLWENRSMIKMESSLKVHLFTIAEDHVQSILKRADKESAIKKEIVGYDMHPLNSEEAIYKAFPDFSEKHPPFLMQRGPDGSIRHSQGLTVFHIFKRIIRHQLTKATKLARSYLNTGADVMFIFLSFSVLWLLF